MKRKGIQWWLPIASLLGIAALTYLTRVGDLTYYKDDWYYVYDATIGGASIFREMFSIDRPARGIFFEIYYQIFGSQALPYHISAFAWRILAGLSGWWLFRMLWPKARKPAYLMTVLFLLYPGYLWWISAIEYQPMIASLALQVLSIALTIKALQTDNLTWTIILATSAILTGWAYILLVDYAIGMEVFRFLCILLFIRGTSNQYSLKESLMRALRAWTVYLVIPFGFLIWRTLFFSGERKATDIGLQLGVLLADPLTTTLKWFIQSIQSTWNVGIAAWVVPFSSSIFGLRLRDGVTALLLSIMVSLIVWRTIRFSFSSEDDKARDSNPPEGWPFPRQALIIGIIGIIFGIFPVVAANRSVTFNLSHYALPASLAGVVFVSGLIYSINDPGLRSGIFSGMVALAVMTHYALVVNTILEEKTIQEFWWQVSWRAPSIQPGTLLVIHYPSSSIGDDGFGVMEAPNLIYFPEASVTAEGFVHYSLAALTASDQNVKDILVGKRYLETGYRSHTINFDYGNTLLLSQPTASSCVHVIDGTRPGLSASDPAHIVLTAATSKIDLVLPDGPAHIPPKFAFGVEPEHGWCYFYEKADLAVQNEDWVMAASLGDEATRLELTPEDQAEWMPFVEAYAALGDEKKVKNLSTRIGIDDFVRIQTCKNLMSNPVIRDSSTPEMDALLLEKYCRNVDLTTLSSTGN
jgi:hypothetical protein